MARDVIDWDYVENKLAQLRRGTSYTPSELSRVLMRLATAVDSKVITEAEFDQRIDLEATREQFEREFPRPACVIWQYGHYQARTAAYHLSDVMRYRSMFEVWCRVHVVYKGADPCRIADAG